MERSHAPPRLVARPLYSTRFALHTVASAAPELLYTVPAGYVAILRDVDYLMTGSAALALSLQVSGRTCVYLSPAPVAGVGYDSWRGRIVMNAGETLTSVVPGWTVQTADIHAGGYLLTVA